MDQWGTERVMRFGLLGVGSGSVVFAALPAPTGIAGYLAPLVMITVGYALFQTANTTAVLRDLPSDQRGVVSGMLNLSRNLGLITGASVMGAVFAFASRVPAIAEAGPEALGSGLRITFAVAPGWMAGAWILVARHRGTEPLPSLQNEPAR